MLTHNLIAANRENNRAYPGKDERRAALLLAGGDGKRLQELTCQIAGVPIPKQYCRLLRGASLLEATIARARLLFPPDHINVIMNRNHMDHARDQVNTLPESNIFVQPLNRDTGPGMVLALLRLERAYGDALLAVFPTDHYINKDWMFIAHVMRAMNAVALHPDKIAILGIVPDRPETGYGYILPSDALNASGSIYHVKAFTEKPKPAAAQEIIACGGLWNTFVMVFRLSRMLELMQETVPEEVLRLSDVRNNPDRAMDLYPCIPPWNFSVRVLARIPQHLIALRIANIVWSDWGTRESIERTYKTLNLIPSWKLAKAGGRNAHVKEAVRNLSKMSEQDYIEPSSR